MLLSAVSVLVVAQSSSEIPEGIMNNPVFLQFIVKVKVSLSLTARRQERIRAAVGWFQVVYS